MANKVLIKFEASGHDPLIKAIKTLAKVQGTLREATKKTEKITLHLNKTQNNLSQISDKVTKGLQKQALQQKKVKDGLLNISNNGRLVHNAFATIRSQLLLLSFGMTLVTGSILKLVNAFAEQELSERRLTIALGHHSQALLDNAVALQKRTKFGDETINNAQAMIAVFVKDEDQIIKVTKATLDLASAKGMDLNTAADLVAKSIGSSTNSLSRYGIEAEGAAGSTERLDSIVSDIQEKFGGFAAGELDTVSGQLQAMRNAVGDAAEAFGGILAPAVTTVAKGIKAVSEAMDPARIKSYISSLLLMAAAYEVVAIATKGATIAAISLKRALIATGVGALFVALGELINQLGLFDDKAEESADTVSNLDYALLGLGFKELKVLTADLNWELQKHIDVREKEKRISDELKKSKDDSIKSLRDHIAALKSNNGIQEIDIILRNKRIALGRDLKITEHLLVTEIYDHEQAIKKRIKTQSDAIKQAKLEKDVARDSQIAMAKMNLKTQEETELFENKLSMFKKMSQVRGNLLNIMMKGRSFQEVMNSLLSDRNIILGEEQQFSDAAMKSLREELITRDKNIKARWKEINALREKLALESHTEAMAKFELNLAAAKKEHNLMTDKGNKLSQTEISRKVAQHKLAKEETALLEIQKGIGKEVLEDVDLERERKEQIAAVKTRLMQIDVEQLKLTNEQTDADERAAAAQLSHDQRILSLRGQLLVQQEKQRLMLMEETKERKFLKDITIKLTDEEISSKLKSFELDQEEKELTQVQVRLLEAQNDTTQDQNQILEDLATVKLRLLEIDNEKLELDEKLTAAQQAKLALTKSEIAASIQLGKSYKFTGNAAKDAANIAIQATLESLQVKLMAILAEHMESVATDVPFPASLAVTAILPALLAGLISSGFGFVKNLATFETGGLVGGTRHSQGGTMIEAERGEFVMSRNAVESIGISNLEIMNATGTGAINVAVTGNVMTSDFVEGELAEKIAEAVRKGVEFGVS